MEEQTAFQKLKVGLMSALVLGYREMLSYILDANAMGVGTVLPQCKKKRREYYSKTLVPPSVTITLPAGSC